VELWADGKPYLSVSPAGAITLRNSATFALGSDPNPLRTQRPAGAESILGERNLHNDVVVNLRETLPLGNHSGGVDRDNLGGDGSVHRLTDLKEDLFRLPPVGYLREERGVRRDPVNQAGFSGPLDLGDLGGVEKDLHPGSSIVKCV
jgi:hypothetical protein